MITCRLTVLRRKLLKYGAIERSIISAEETAASGPTPTHCAKAGDPHRIVDMYIGEYSLVGGIAWPQGMGHGQREALSIHVRPTVRKGSTQQHTNSPRT